jgi:hypothetical protein
MTITFNDLDNNEEVLETCDTCEEVIDDCLCCGSCGEYPCACCYTCGHVECECCGNCENYPCSCESGMGTTQVSPWSVDPKLIAKYTHEPWDSIWNVENTRTDPLQDAATFYLLEGMAHHAIFPGLKITKRIFPTRESDDLFFASVDATKAERKEITRVRDQAMMRRCMENSEYYMQFLARDAEERLSKHVDRVDKTLVNYMQMACAGEIRHHVAMRSNNVLNSERDVAWSEWKAIFDTVGPKALLDMASLFREFEDCSYGGEAWAVPAEILYSRLVGELGPDEFSNKKMFIDRIWTLEHNGGCFLDKVTWARKNSPHWGLSKMKVVLDAHAAEVPDYATLYRCAPSEVQELFSDYVTEGVKMLKDQGEESPAFVLDMLEHPRMICRRCFFNARLGHLPSCGASRNQPPDGDISDGHYIAMYRSLESHYDLDSSVWTEDGEGRIYVGHDGVLHLPSDTEFILELRTWSNGPQNAKLTFSLDPNSESDSGGVNVYQLQAGDAFTLRPDALFMSVNYYWYANEYSVSIPEKYLRPTFNGNVVLSGDKFNPMSESPIVIGAVLQHAKIH